MSVKNKMKKLYFEGTLLTTSPSPFLDHFVLLTVFHPLHYSSSLPQVYFFFNVPHPLLQFLSSSSLRPVGIRGRKKYSWFGIPRQNFDLNIFLKQFSYFSHTVEGISYVNQPKKFFFKYVGTYFSHF
jgi:hypothetical protein